MADFVATFLSKASPQFVPADSMDYVGVFAPRLTDASPPVVDQISPAPDAGPIAKAAAVSFRLRDDGEFTLREMLIRFGDAVSFDWVHDGTEFKGRYGNSTMTPVAEGWMYTITREGGWPPGTRVRLRLYVVDAGGNLVVIDA